MVESKNTCCLQAMGDYVKDLSKIATFFLKREWSINFY